MKNIRMFGILMLMLLTNAFVNPLMADDDYRKMSKSFDVSDFEAIDVNIPCDIEYIPAAFSSPKLVIYARTEEALSAIKVEVKDKVLILKVDAANFIKTLRSIDVYVSSRRLNALKINGAADFEAPDGINADDKFSLQINGSGDIEIEGLRVPHFSMVVNGAGDAELSELNCEQIDIVINGAGDCELEGRTESINVKVNGAGDVDITELKADKVNSSIRGAGSVR